MKTFCFHVEDETPVSKRSLIDELAVALKRANLGELKFQEVPEKLSSSNSIGDTGKKPT
jgi:hypothetical protein